MNDWFGSNRHYCRRSVLLGFVAATVLVADCSGGGATGGRTVCNTVAVPAIMLAYPISGTTGVSPNIGSLIVSGVAGPGQTIVTVTAPSGVIANATPSPAPSPLPSPLTTSAPAAGPSSYSAVALPTLTPNTMYTITATYSVGSASATCPTSFPTTLGSFTTG
jgi:hypothetical protein